MSDKEKLDRLNDALTYALRCGCLFPVPIPTGKKLTTKNLIKWGAMRNLHSAIAEVDRG